MCVIRNKCTFNCVFKLYTHHNRSSGLMVKTYTHKCIIYISLGQVYAVHHRIIGLPHINDKRWLIHRAHLRGTHVLTHIL